MTRQWDIVTGVSWKQCPQYYSNVYFYLDKAYLN